MKARELELRGHELKFDMLDLTLSNAPPGAFDSVYRSQYLAKVDCAVPLRLGPDKSG